MPRTFEQNKIIKIQRKKEVCASAIRLFAAKGFENVSVDEITRSAGCSHGLFYRYYRNQSDVFLSIERDIMNRENGKYLIRFKDFAKEGGIAGLNDFLKTFSTIAQGEEDVLYYYATLARNDFELSSVPSAYYGPEDRIIFQELIKEAMDAGTIRKGDPLEVANLCYDIISGGLMRKVHAKGNPVSLETLKRVF